MKHKNHSNSPPLNESTEAPEDAPDGPSHEAAEEHDKGFCPGQLYGQRDAFGFADLGGGRVGLGPLICGAIAFVSQEGAPAPVLPDSLLAAFHARVGAGDLNAEDEDCWHLGVLSGLLSIAAEIAEAAEALDLRFIHLDLPN